MARVALLCWEIGGGLGHVVGLLQVARALKARGWSCVFAFPPEKMAAKLMPRGADVRLGPEWSRMLPPGFVRTGSSASMADMLADTGLRSAEGIRAQIIGWHLVFAEMLPDIVIADHAPGAILAARGRIATVAVGTGFSVPPAGLERFPPLHELAPLRDDENAIRETVNAVLARFGSPPLAHLSDALTADAALACTVPLLDPYAGARREPVLGPLTAPRVPPAEETPRDIVACYFQAGTDRRRVPKLADALRDIGLACVAYVPKINAQERRLFASAGISVEAAALGVDPLARARLIVHAGGHATASAALLAGVPQVVLHYDIEKELTGKALASRGVARRLAFDTATAAAVREAIVAGAGDTELQRTAHRAAEEHASYRGLRVAELIADRCEQLAG